MTGRYDGKGGYKGEPPVTILQKLGNVVHYILDTPTTWFRETVVEPNRPTYYWYHRKFRRVPTIDQCYTDDVVCEEEANEQFKRDKRVDAEIIKILRRRKEDCIYQEGPDYERKCVSVVADYDEATNNYFIKYGDLAAFATVVQCYMKQKHRLLWERRHGPVGSGMRPQEEWGKGDADDQ